MELIQSTMLLQNPGDLFFGHVGDIGNEGQVEPFGVGVEDDLYFNFDFPLDLSFFNAFLYAHFNAFLYTYLETFVVGSSRNEVVGGHDIVLIEHC